MVNMLYLTYPYVSCNEMRLNTKSKWFRNWQCLIHIYSSALLYFFFFGFAGEPFLELIPRTTNEKYSIYREPRTGKEQRSVRIISLIIYVLRFADLPLGAYKTTYVPPGPRVYPGPEAVRKEMDLFKVDFNARFKQVAFNSICCAYYSTFIPCAFATVGNLYFLHRHRWLHFSDSPMKYSTEFLWTHYYRVLCSMKWGTQGAMSFCRSPAVSPCTLSSASPPLTCTHSTGRPTTSGGE